MFKIGDLVRKAANGFYPLDKGIGIGYVVRVKEYIERTDYKYDLYYVDWIHSNEQYAYEAKELILVSEA